jgi:hypothetical protein
MENVDPLGIHTGESIVVAPSQTLTDRKLPGTTVVIASYNSFYWENDMTSVWFKVREREKHELVFINQCKKSPQCLPSRLFCESIQKANTFLGYLSLFMKKDCCWRTLKKLNLLGKTD